MADGEKSGLADLEKELTCSICTELLYQPLTLLDCLHTFCGACLKEWFAFQASTATSLHPYTCPSCRATVQKTQRNASVTTLLEVFLKANPGKGKSEEDKKADREKYKPGDNVLPKLRRRDGEREEELEDEERRMLERVQELSLRERRRRERSRDGSSSRRRERDGRASDDRRSRSAHREAREVVPSRHVEHQSSLRSLLSASELDSQEIEEEIMRQIMEEGLLDGIDLDNIDVAQEDEISERIAQAYRSRQAQRQRERRERRERLAREGRIDVAASRTATPQDEGTPSLREDERPRRRTQGRSESGASTPAGQTSSRPPVSRPALIDAANNNNVRGHHRRSSSQGSHRSSRRAERPAALALGSTRQAGSSTSDLEERPSTSSSRPSRRRQSDNQQRSTLDERQQFQSRARGHTSSNPNSPRRMVFNMPQGSQSSSALTTSPPVGSPAASNAYVSTHAAPTARRTTDPTSVRGSRQPSTPPIPLPATFSPSATDVTPGEAEPKNSSSDTPAIAAPPPRFPEPVISCNRCGKEHIEHQLHYNCSRCDKGAYNLCLSCYRAGKGCKHWYGFGWAAWPRYERQAPPGGYPPGHEHPHILVGRRYLRPISPLSESTPSPHVLMSQEDPNNRLEEGVFCEACSAFANGCYWKCDICNEGAWGFCNSCVNQGRHCTHPLLPMAHQPQPPLHRLPSDSTAPTTTPPTTAPPRSPGLAPPSQGTSSSTATTPPPSPTPASASLVLGPGLISLARSTFKPLTFTTLCNKCNYPIPPSHTRYHCLRCNNGDYDICAPCYHKLVVSGRTTKEDGMAGWRRCPRGHRMVVVGFEDRDGGQRRVVVRELVGGWALRDEAESDGSIHRYRTPHASSSSSSPSTTLRFPPDGGIGLRVLALWSYFPAEGVDDELGFPRHAEIREVEDINGDWYWGVYAGAKGLFPGNYGRIVGGS
ncbi:uncharacterized protein EI97DRAFT_417035 [Westerdykella ornata]|uniref:RING-type domain-containing protein n=1 Tax=Westerdykella ornata TaxID=318751 RepID=A0A6A6JQ10_WESOR|nr:uncharacterized protein EI97DRAFT_417035 [Westerdykella ornata]KAF2277049.1 hypothetical protein EI97DRAFT_417035 [Westerdykella ornata]